MSIIYLRTIGKSCCACYFAFSLVCAFNLLPHKIQAQMLEAKSFAMELSATVQKTPASITIVWPQNTGNSNSRVAVSRRVLGTTAWTPWPEFQNTTTSFTDTDVSVGTVYEYSVTQGSARGVIAAGIEILPIDNRGKIILVVDSTYAGELSAELSRLQQDLVGDGWIVVRRDVARNETVPNVKAVIKAVYDADPINVKAVFLFGHIPVPYSGYMAPDGHQDHTGAWPADVFYADMDSVWTDSSVNYTESWRPENRNIPGDGKYDQSRVPTDTELEIGRVDLANMPAFAPKTELDLLRQYLNKDHNFRAGLLSAERRALVDDNFGAVYNEGFAASGWRNFSTFFGASNVEAKRFLPELETNSYLWGYGCGPGWWTGANGVAETSDFAASDPKVIFTMLYGSYFGDWDVADNFLRAPLATTTYGLTSVWAGRPHWSLHQMALGKNIGYSARLNQNDSYPYENDYYSHFTHIALMGDPTLRMHAVLPPSALTATKSGANVVLHWTASPDADHGYLVYRASSLAGSFVKLTDSPVTTVSFIDQNAATGNYVYQVRAVKLETTGSGTYFNTSQGIFSSTAAKKLFDFDGDGRDDVSVFRPSDNTWYLNGSSAELTSLAFGISNDALAPADYDGDGKTDVAVFRSGIWYLLQSSNNQVRVLQFGQSGDAPVPADYDGDGKADVAVWRASNGTWYRLNSSNNSVTTFAFGVSTDKPVPADYDGDGKTDVAVYRDGTWYMQQSINGFRSAQWGIATDKAVVADYDGDSKADLAVFRPSNGTWYILRSAEGILAAQFGISSDVPTAADYDGDGKTDLAVFRPSNGTWYVIGSTAGFSGFQFGLATDKPVPNTFVP